MQDLYQEINAQSSIDSVTEEIFYEDHEFFEELLWRRRNFNRA